MALVFVGSNPTVHPIFLPPGGGRAAAEIATLEPATRVDEGLGVIGMRLPGRRWLLLVLGVVVAAVVGAACENSDDAERLAAQRLFRNYLIQADSTAAADVRIEGLVDDLPPDFPVFEDLSLLGSAFTDTATRRELIVGWESETPADDIFVFYSDALNSGPWSVVQDPRLVRIDFIDFRDADDPTFRGELRIAQEGDSAVVILIARNLLGSPDNTTS